MEINNKKTWAKNKRTWANVEDSVFLPTNSPEEPMHLEVVPADVVRGSNGRFIPGHPRTSPAKGVRRGTLNLTSQLRMCLREEYGDGKTRGQHLMDILIQTATSGDVAAIKEVLNRIDGKVPDKIHIGVDLLKDVSDKDLIMIASEND